jgi:thiosulfate reductase/polysulfide reductase chain A
MKRHTICRLCSSCCPVEVEIEDGRLVSAARKSFLPREKQLICPKLKAAAEITYSPHRLKTPLIRDDRGNFREASWEEALDRVADGFLHCKKTYGARSVCWLRGMAADWGAPWDYANRLMNAFGSPNTIGNGSVCHVGREMAHTLTYGAMTIPQVRKARCILVWGKNDRDTSPNMAEGIIWAKENGAKLIVVDPVKTWLAGQADLWLPIKPAHDGLLAMAMLHEIITTRRYDEKFVQEWTVGFEALKKVAEKFPIEKVAPEVWLQPDQIRRAVELYTAHKPACIVDGNGLDMQITAFDATRAVCLLRALTGNLDREGGDFIPQPVPLRNIQLKERLPQGVEPITRDYPLFNTFHDTWGRQVQSCVIDALLDEKPYPIKMLVVQSGNPLVTLMDAGRVEKALKKLEFLVTIDPFLNRTGRMAHVVLPASLCFEKTQLNRAHIRNNPLMIQQQVIEPVGESRPDWWIVFELARRLGLEREFPWKTVEEAIDYQLEPLGVTTAMVKKNPEGFWVEKPVYEKYKQTGFKTPSGKVEFYSERLAQAGFPAVPFADGFPQGVISYSDRSERYPFVGISGARTSRFTHSQFRMIPSLAQEEKGCVVDIHPEDAKKIDVSAGDRVRVETPRGCIVMKAHISQVVRPGSIRIAWGWGEVNPEYNLNRLTDDDRRNPVIGTPSGRSFMCRIEKVV